MYQRIIHCTGTETEIIFFAFFAFVGKQRLVYGTDNLFAGREFIQKIIQSLA